MNFEFHDVTAIYEERSFRYQISFIRWFSSWMMTTLYDGECLGLFTSKQNPVNLILLDLSIRRDRS